MKRPLKSLVVISCLASSVAMADPLKEIFPWKPFALEEINSRVSRLTEEANPMMNVYDMERA